MRTAILVFAAIAAVAGAVIWAEQPRPVFGPHFLNRSIVKDAGWFGLFWKESTPPDVTNGHESFSEHVLLIR
ncbi:MAG TPA: hypothetical protein VNU44_17965 [Bryobacteraceae bacterium]|jgi:hypothetical protein|nr:hypothetical protein [Bryobacteraceae bacterium]